MKVPGYACKKCGGRGKIVYSHNEAFTPSLKFKRCQKCKGTGRLTK